MDSAAVFPVSDERKSAGSELYADLVCAAGMKADEDQGNRLTVIFRRGEQFPRAGCFLYAGALAADDERFVFRPVMPQQVHIIPGCFSRTAADRCQVCFFDPILLKQALQRGAGRGGTGKHDHSAGTLIKPVDRPKIPPELLPGQFRKAGRFRGNTDRFFTDDQGSVGIKYRYFHGGLILSL